MSCRHYRVSGRVQGVFYRASTAQKAESLGLTGWVKNLPDGCVEALACGAESALAALEAWMQQGPSHAVVDKLETRELAQDESESIDAQRAANFQIRY